MDLERTHTEFLSQDERFAVVDAGWLGIRKVTMHSAVAEES